MHLRTIHTAISWPTRGSAVLPWSAAFLLFLLFATPAAAAADRPQWGERPSRNMASSETGLPDSFDAEAGRNIRWSVPIGTQTHSTPVVAGGKVFIGTNNNRPRDPKHVGDRGVLMCFDEKTGRFLWQLLAPKLLEDPYLDWPGTGMVSPATVEGDRVYFVTNRAEVVCLDIDGMADGNDGPYRDEGAHLAPPEGPPEEAGPTDADIIWLFDLRSGAGVRPHDGSHCSVLVLGDRLYINTSNGVDNTHCKITKPEAPGLVVLDKGTGRLLAQDGERMAPRTIHSTWSSPAAGDVGGRTQVFFCGGDAVCYAFEPLGAAPEPGKVAVLKKVWWFDLDTEAPKEDVHRWQDNRSEGPSVVLGMPVFYEGRVYVSVGGDIWHGKPKARLVCIDASRSGDMTKGGEVWSAPMGRHCVSTPAIRDGLVYMADCSRTIHCLEASTGQSLWTHKAQGEIWASPLVADGKVFIGSKAGDFWILKAGREKAILSTVDLDDMSGSPVAANGTLYIATMSRLIAAAVGVAPAASTAAPAVAPAASGAATP